MRTRTTSLEVEFEPENQNDPVRTFEVSATVEEFVPGNRRGNIDTWEPDEGGCAYDLEVTEGGKKFSLDAFEKLMGKAKMRKIKENLVRSADRESQF